MISAHTQAAASLAYKKAAALATVNIMNEAKAVKIIKSETAKGLRKILK